tara:strand:+ start:235 stop:477 length:243 start_codon:yes stop_codon:yes gene_type:complete
MIIDLKEKGRMLELKNFLEEVCVVLLVKLDMDDSYVEEWVQTPNQNLNMQTPLEVFVEEGILGRVGQLLHWMEIGEADVA